MGERDKRSRLSDILNLEQLQTLQDHLSKALGMAFVTVDYRGQPVTKASGFTDFCSCMKRGENSRLCSQCYAHGGLYATMAGKPYSYLCHCGLVEFAVPLIVGGKYLGAVMGGQCTLEGEKPELYPVLPQSTLWEEDPELLRAREKVHTTTREKLESGISLVQEILKNKLEEEKFRQVREELQQKDRELTEEKAARANLELSRKGEAGSGMPESFDRETIFYMLNVISRLAFLEKAEQTERTVCDFASMMRYVLENGEYTCVTLGEELEYIDYYLQIRQRQTGERLCCSINVPEKFHSTLCPFMMLHPLVNDSVKYVLDNSREGGTLLIYCWEENNLLVLAICFAYAGLMDLQREQTQEPEVRRQGSPVARLDQNLKDIFGPECGAIDLKPVGGLLGREIQIRLPRNGGTGDR